MTIVPPGLRVAAAAMLVAAAATLVACGDEASPAEAVPELAERLETVDTAIADERPARARRAIEALVDEATRARMNDEITADQADEILRAAAELLELLPTAPDIETPGPTDPTTSEPPGLPDPEPDEEKEDDDKDKKDDETDDKKDDRKDDRDDGDEGRGGGNGPDDGHGN